jgi:hypothetical protein
MVSTVFYKATIFIDLPSKGISGSIRLETEQLAKIA